MRGKGRGGKKRDEGVETKGQMWDESLTRERHDKRVLQEKEEEEKKRAREKEMEQFIKTTKMNSLVVTLA